MSILLYVFNWGNKHFYKTSRKFLFHFLLSSNISSNCNIDLYADDSTIHHTNTDINEINMYLQESVDKVSQWCKNNNMCINPNKSKCMVISSNSQLKKTK